MRWWTAEERAGRGDSPTVGSWAALRSTASGLPSGTATRSPCSTYRLSCRTPSSPRRSANFSAADERGYAIERDRRGDAAPCAAILHDARNRGPHHGREGQGSGARDRRPPQGAEAGFVDHLRQRPRDDRVNSDKLLCQAEIIRSLAFIVSQNENVIATLAYLGLAILGWGGFAAFFSHPPLIARSHFSWCLAWLFFTYELPPPKRRSASSSAGRSASSRATQICSLS